MSKPDVHSEARSGNVVGDVALRPRASDEYYSYMVMKAKIDDAATTAISADEKTALKSLSDLEILEMRTLAKLNRLSDASPELLAYYSLCNTSDRMTTAKVVARKAYRKAVVANSLNALVSPDDLATAVATNDNKSRANRADVNAFGISNPSARNAFGNL